MKYIWYAFLGLFSLGFLGLIAGVALFGFGIQHFSKDLPDYAQLKDYKPPIVTRLYAGDGRLMAEYASEKRVFVPIEFIPDTVKNAFIAAEDQNFYKHEGLDFRAIARAALTNISNMGTGRRPEGASTITQQVAKNFLLSNEVSYTRKIREAILAYRMEQALPKERLLELYLNEIYLGGGVYGVGAAALHYFDKSLKELEIHEAAYLAALPKAPNNYHPERHREAALERRNWVLGRMADDGYITKSQASLARLEALNAVRRDNTEEIGAPYFAEEVRRELAREYKTDGLYGGGLAVRSSMDPGLQRLATETLRAGLMDYDMRWGYRGPVDTIELDDWRAKLNRMDPPENMIAEWDMAVVLSASDAAAEIGFGNKPKGRMDLDGVKWARESLQDGYARGPVISRVDQVLSPGDIILVEDTTPEDAGRSEENRLYALRQIPRVQGAIIALDPHTGRVLAMQGGWTYDASEFNRATQADRQPGSAFKPFVYLAALDRGFTPATLVLDAPFVYEHRPGEFWSPSNYSREYYGPTPIRVGVEKSKNLMTVRLADYLGMDTVAEYSERLGIADDMPLFLSFSLGAMETTLLDLTSAYAVLVNGGKKITPTFIDRIQDRHGKTLFKHDKRECVNCGDLIRWQNQQAPDVPDTRPQIADPRTAYQMVSILQGVIERGTGTRARSLGRPLAGKTGTTNESKDTWFIGFSPNLVAGVFVGYDEPRSLGKKETGASVALPIWADFMGRALEGQPPAPFRIPPGIRQVQINAKTGTRAQPGDESVIWEAFVTGTEPTDDVFILDSGGMNTIEEKTTQEAFDPSSVTTGTGGLY